MEYRLPVRTIGACFALTAFAVAVLAGLGAALPASEILWRATLSLCVCYAAGVVIGSVAERAAKEHVSGFVRLHPMGQGATSSRTGIPGVPGVPGSGGVAQSSQGERP